MSNCSLAPLLVNFLIAYSTKDTRRQQILYCEMDIFIHVQSTAYSLSTRDVWRKQTPQLQEIIMLRTFYFQIKISAELSHCLKEHVCP